MIERCVDPVSGQRAVTHYVPLSRNPDNDTTALRVRLETGRTHQIRVHMAYIGHPVVGDTLYGSEASADGNRREAQGMPPVPVPPAALHSDSLIGRQALHSLQLEFMHPITRQMLSFEAPVPDDIRSLLRADTGSS